MDHPGVPFLVKNVLTTEAGQPYHSGLRAARDAGHLAAADSWLLGRYRDAGLASLGRTNTAELAMSLTTEPPAYDPTRHPWDPAHSPSRCSGGLAAAVAPGMVAAAYGNDMAGFLRVPAANSLQTTAKAAAAVYSPRVLYLCTRKSFLAVSRVAVSQALFTDATPVPDSGTGISQSHTGRWSLPGDPRQRPY